MSATKILSGQVFLFGSRLVLKIATPVPTVDGGRLMVRSMAVND